MNYKCCLCQNELTIERGNIYYCNSCPFIDSPRVLIVKSIKEDSIYYDIRPHLDLEFLIVSDPYTTNSLSINANGTTKYYYNHEEIYRESYVPYEELNLSSWTKDKIETYKFYQ